MRKEDGERIVRGAVPFGIKRSGQAGHLRRGSLCNILAEDGSIEPYGGAM
jgi:hypothetical protein